MSKDANKILKDEIDRIEREEIDKERSYVRNVVRPKKPAQVYSVRIPVEAIETLRRIAAARGVQPSVLMRDWILERLSDEAAPRRLMPRFGVGSTGIDLITEEGGSVFIVLKGGEPLGSREAALDMIRSGARLAR